MNSYDSPLPAAIDGLAVVIETRWRMYSSSSAINSAGGRSWSDLTQSVSHTCRADTVRPASTDGRMAGASPAATASVARSAMWAIPILHASRWLPRPIAHRP